MLGEVICSGSPGEVLDTVGSHTTGLDVDELQRSELGRQGVQAGEWDEWNPDHGCWGLLGIYGSEWLR